jgi:hypothetical protein
MLIIQNHQPAIMPTNEYMRGIYQLVPGRIVHTPKGRRINRILEVGDDYVIIQSTRLIQEGLAALASMTSATRRTGQTGRSFNRCDN